VSNHTRSERPALIEREPPDLIAGAQAELLNLSRSSLYYKPIPLVNEK
jgi:hypothetical protein